ncbi:unnamed protein product [Didymodactylos carnosus]|uniref:Uncharacterized protein n=1 Tax=Didymodactylos carnosus TaxID=1234261 RepID=A0A815D3Q7_9BILA|nr:unnamed protein product [Didymodactylos carnosus]CAF1293307.1 unnamed protein product [Didymodactylos carnosus]CAF3523397.1 unnamed protein product [Didymodactylos carnosus]CAF4103096.1 unnamed protein product [Didymodactylos carnosus]
MFKRIMGPADDGADPKFTDQNPSKPVMIKTPVNGKVLDVMVDTGSVVPIIHTETLRKLAHRPYFHRRSNTHYTANNGELRTIRVGTDWITRNKIDVRGSKKCIEVRYGNHHHQWASVPFLVQTDEKQYPVQVLHSVTLPSSEAVLIRVKVPIRFADTVIFNPDASFGSHRKVLFANALLKVENYVASISVINLSQFKRHLHSDALIGAISFPSPVFQCLPLISTGQYVHTNKIHQCAICLEKFSTSSYLFDHLKKGKYFVRNSDCNHLPKNIPDTVSVEIDKLVEHITNNEEKQEVLALLRRHAKVFDTTTPSTIKTSVKHIIETIPHPPIYQRPYRKSPQNQKFEDEETQKLLDANKIRHSQRGLLPLY